MSRVAKQPVAIPAGVEIKVEKGALLVKGPKGQVSAPLHGTVRVDLVDGNAQVVWEGGNNAMAGTTRALLQNMVTGVSRGFERKLEIVGVGYRAQAKGKTLSLALGFSHPVEYPVPEGISIETPSQTEILIRGVDKQKVGQVAADIRAYRSPEPYKGKGVRYAGEKIAMKEAKKK